MKKFIFLLIAAVLLSGIAFAQDTAYPPRDITLDAALPGYSVQEAAVAPGTYLLAVSLYAPNRIIAISAYIKASEAMLAIEKQALKLTAVDMESLRLCFRANDYWLQL
jgi:hypothetical protein